MTGPLVRLLLLGALCPALLRISAAQEDGLAQEIEGGIQFAEELLQSGDEESAWSCVEELAALIAEQEGVASDEELAVLPRLADLAARRRMLSVLLVVDERILAAKEARLAETDPELLEARHNLAVTKLELGDVEGALELEEAILAVREAALDPGDPELLRARQDVAWMRMRAGEVGLALELAESVVAERARALPPEDPVLLRSQHELAWIMKEAGDLERARALQEAVLETRERVLGEGHPDVIASRTNLGWMMLEVGDLEGARARLEAVLEAHERRSAPGSRDLLVARSGLAVTKREMGDHEGAFALYQAVLEDQERTLPESHPEVLRTRHNLAGLLRAMGRLEEAEEIGAGVLLVWEENLPGGHPELLKARAGLAMTQRELGKFAQAAEHLQIVLEARHGFLPADHPDLLRAREHLIWTRIEAGESEEAARLLAEQHEGVLARHVLALSSSPREARAVVGYETRRVEQLLFPPGALNAAGAFTLLETRRHAATAPAAGSGDPELERLLGRAAKARAALNDLVLGGAPEGGLSAWRERMSALVQERDAALAEVRRELSDRGRVVEAIRPQALAERLPEGAIAAGFHRYLRRERDPDSGLVREVEPALLALVVDGDSVARRVELGSAGEVEELVARWRAQAAGGRGISPGTGTSDPADTQEAGRELRRQIVDPVLAAGSVAEGAQVLVALDDFLHLVPLDALPLDEEGLVVGDRWRIRNEVSFARLLEPDRPAEGEGLLAVGDVDYEAPIESGEAATPDAALVAASAPLRGEGSSGSLTSWEELPGTKAELEQVAALYAASFEDEATTLSGRSATKAALLEHARGKRFVHVATHGWFAPETILSWLDVEAGDDDLASSAGRAVQGLAPMTLCGLCLSGANRGRDELGRVPGLLTAEELAGFDLSACELAVLSACETNVGLRRAGQGILSLQAALHAAGARTTVTSLWRVDDELTRELMERFYRHLWTDGTAKSEALWRAKEEMRKQGHPPSAWAGWILSGAP